jgi:hypothetical protein
MASDHDITADGYARECVRLASLITDHLIRERLFQMAREWMAVAMHEEKTPEPKSPLAQDALAHQAPGRLRHHR